jgi:hypothetical protein
VVRGTRTASRFDSKLYTTNWKSASSSLQQLRRCAVVRQIGNEKPLPEGRVLSSHFASTITVFVLMDSLRYPSCSAVAGATINSIFFHVPFSKTSGNEVSFC